MSFDPTLFSQNYPDYPVDVDYFWLRSYSYIYIYIYIYKKNFVLFRVKKEVSLNPLI